MIVDVIAKLKDGRIATTDCFLPIDALLQRAYAMEYRKDLIGKPMDSLQDAIIFDIPIEKKLKNTDDWYFDCSFAMFEILGTDTKMFNKRYDSVFAEKYLDKQKKVETRKGKFKNWRIPLTVVLTSEIKWCVSTNDAFELDKLIKKIDAIGKKTSQGFGMVKEWTIRETLCDSRHLRAIPNQNGDTMCTIRPLYFDDTNKRVCKIPNDSRLGCVSVYG